MNKENIRKYIRLAILSVVSMIVGSLITIFIRSDGTLKRVSFDYKEFEPLFEAYDELNDKYYKKLDTSKLVDGAINGMMNSLDDEHSIYFDKESKENFDTELSGTYYGIGAQIVSNEDNTVSITKIFDDSPAEKAGLQVDDVFVSIDGKSTENMDATDVASTLRSETSKKATIVINRAGVEKTIEVTKENITLFSVSSDMLDNNIGYISVSIFGEKTYGQFKNALEELENKNMQSLIIDLRGNSGGYLTTVSNMLDLFIERGKVIYKMETNGGIKEYRSKGGKGKNYKIVVLIDENSASASEIMSAALKEQYGAALVGKKTYGKGTVQITSNLSDGTMIKYTIEKWLTPSGNNIDKIGINPDYEVNLSEEYYKNPSNDNDNQLQKALELLK